MEEKIEMKGRDECGCVWCDVRSEGGVRCATETNEVSISRNIRTYEFDEEI